jgi:biopolymer transport protein ExbD
MDNKPNINVTPLIDVLLVLLIIFMVVSPLKPTNFRTKIPQETKQPDNANTHINALVVALESDSSLRINKENDLGTIQNPDKLIKRLSQVFQERTNNRSYSDGAELKNNLTEAEKIEKTVFIKAPRSTDYGSVTKVIDAVKIAGANPISLQIDDLN